MPAVMLMVLQALRLECEKSMELTASSHLSVSVPAEMVGRSGSNRVSPHWGSNEGAIKGLALFIPA